MAKTLNPKHVDVDPRQALADLGVHVWERDLYYGLVRDASAPHGYRLVASGKTLDQLLASYISSL